LTLCAATRDLLISSIELDSTDQSLRLSSSSVP
jgi:hypothetical protein